MTYQLPEGWTAHDEGECRSCHAPILWAVNDKSGKSSPFDPAKDEAPSVSHFATCPQAGQWRKKGAHHL